VTGVYLWFKNHKQLWIGWVLLGAGTGLALGLVVSMRRSL